MRFVSTSVIFLMSRRSRLRAARGVRRTQSGRGAPLD
jgi:hypothetical protein